MPYINKEELLTKAKARQNGVFAAPVILNLIEKAPEVDVVEVVRCKECKHYKLRSQSARWSPNKPCCTRKANVKVDENDFCSFGKRKEGAD